MMGMSAEKVARAWDHSMCCDFIVMPSIATMFCRPNTVPTNQKIASDFKVPWLHR